MTLFMTRFMIRLTDVHASVFTPNPAGTEAGRACHGESQMFSLSTSLWHVQRKDKSQKTANPSLNNTRNLNLRITRKRSFLPFRRVVLWELKFYPYVICAPQITEINSRIIIIIIIKLNSLHKAIVFYSIFFFFCFSFLISLQDK